MARNHRLIAKKAQYFSSLDQIELCNIIKTSFLTEKTVELEEKHNIIVLKVHKKYNKQMIKFATEAVFTGTKVEKVSTMNYKSVVKNHRGRLYNTTPYKKAYIRLSKDSTIELGENQTAITKFTNSANSETDTKQEEKE